MNDVEKIFVVLAILYAIESTFWVRRGTVALTSIAGRFLWSGTCLSLIGNEKGRLVLSGPLPIDASFVAQSLPVSISEHGVVGFLAASPMEPTRPLHSERFFNWEQLEKIRADENRVLVAEELLCKVRNAIDARVLANDLNRIANLPSEDRASEILQMTSAEFNLQAAIDRIGKWRLQTRKLQLTSSALFYWLFPIGLSYYFDLVPGTHHPVFLIVYLSIVFILWWTISWRLFQDHRTLYPDNRLGRIKLVITSLISPGVAIRGRDHLARDLFSFLHPLTLCCALLPPPMKVAYARSVWRDIEFPSFPASLQEMDSISISTEATHRIRAKKFIESLIQQSGMSLESIVAAPMPNDSMSVAYCPRCHQEFTRIDASCSACGDRPVVQY